MNNYYEDVVDESLGWEDEISRDNEFILLPEGEYAFTVTKMERGYFNGSAKMSKCNKAELTIKVSTPDGKSTTVTHNLFLHRKCEGLLCAFFTSIGQRKHGETLRPNWQAVVGASGRCKVGIHEWTGNDGQTRQSNEITRFLEPAAGVQQTAPASKAFTPGNF